MLFQSFLLKGGIRRVKEWRVWDSQKVRERNKRPITSDRITFFFFLFIASGTVLNVGMRIESGIYFGQAEKSGNSRSIGFLIQMGKSKFS